MWPPVAPAASRVFTRHSPFGQGITGGAWGHDSRCALPRLPYKNAKCHFSEFYNSSHSSSSYMSAYLVRNHFHFQFQFSLVPLAYPPTLRHPGCCSRWGRMASSSACDFGCSPLPQHLLTLRDWLNFLYKSKSNCPAPMKSAFIFPHSFTKNHCLIGIRFDSTASLQPPT